MNRLSYRALFTILLCALPLACSSDPTGPEMAIQEFYGHLNDGDYTQAMALYNSDARGTFEDPEAVGDSMFDEWARTETKHGKVDRVRVVEEQATEYQASVQFEIVYTDGTRASRSVTVLQESGAWKLGFIN